jgi:hypothetical protein
VRKLFLHPETTSFSKSAAQSLQFQQFIGLLLLHLDHFYRDTICCKDFGAALEVLRERGLKTQTMLTWFQNVLI